MPFFANSFFALSFLVRWVSPIPRNGELNVVVPDDLDAVAPGIAEVKEMGIY
jgi:hypothetical protein